VTGRERLLDGAPVLQRSVALRNPYVDSLSELQVRLLAGCAACRRTTPSVRGCCVSSSSRSTVSRPGSRAPASVDHADHVRLLRGAVEPGGTWADVGCRAGAFTLALADLLGPGGRVIAVDRSQGRAGDERGGRGRSLSRASDQTLARDYTGVLALPRWTGS
jgi:hypothetical protein